MIAYLGECMTVAVQTAIGAFLWLGVVVFFVSLIGIASYLLKREKDQDVDAFINGLIQGDKDET